MVYLRKAWLVVMSALLVACQSPREALQQLADAHDRQVEVLPGGAFPLLILAPRTASDLTRLRVYLEGDGHAWATASQPSVDPSPHNLLVARLALADPTPNAYLARPCQFVMSAACRPELWTNRRFSQDVVTRLSQGLDQLKQRFGNQEFELVGYSGGAALALLLAAQRTDVSQVQTLAGNLSPRLWAAMKNLSPLDGSLEPLDYRARLAPLPQRHLVGTVDPIIPATLADKYQQALDSPLSHTVRIDGASHDQGWEAAWSEWLETPLTNGARQKKTTVDHPTNGKVPLIAD
nr:alpha/beta hydrolase [uncultured Pseudomonas sp.]